MKAVKITLAGRERYLAFTVEAMFAIQEIFGSSGELIEAKGGQDFLRPAKRRKFCHSRANLSGAASGTTRSP